MAEFGAHIPGNNTRDSSGNIISPESNNLVSDYINYGSYSGADIRVIVHYPNAAKIKALDEAEYEKNAVIQELESYAESNPGNTPELKQEYDEAVTVAANRLEELNVQIKKINEMPTSKVLAEIQTISWSTHRDKIPLRTFGAVYPRSFTRGNRTVAGSIVFTLFNEHPLHEILDLNLGTINTGTSDRDLYKYTTNLIDQLPPLDLSIIGSNEYGAVSHMGLYGVEFVQEGGTFSIEDIFSESVVQYVARDMDPLRIAGLRKINGQGVTNEWTMTAGGLAYQKNRSNSYLTRRSPFI